MSVLNLRRVSSLLVNASSSFPNLQASVHNEIEAAQSKIRKELRENVDYLEKHDPDMFGSFVKAQKQRQQVVDDGDVKESRYLESPPTRKLSTRRYADIIKDYIRKRKIKEAIDVIEVRMLEQDRVKPENYIYNLVIGACGRVGYTKKAFALYNDMKKRQLQPTGGTYTALFNACANSPWQNDGLQRSKKLWEIIKERSICLNDTNYNAMIKAFGKCGDLNSAFCVADEMVQNGIPVTQSTINFLLHSCISDRESGFRHALYIWRKLYENKVTPNIFSYNLLLRCVRDCGAGFEPGRIAAGNEHNTLTCNTYPALSRHSDIEQILVNNNVCDADNRLAVIGGHGEILGHMESTGVAPDIKTVTLLLECEENSLKSEESMLQLLRSNEIPPDVEFLNSLMKKRVLRYDYEGARSVLDLFNNFHLRPNVMTYGILALSCETKKESDELLACLATAGYRLNIEILGALLGQACVNLRTNHVLELMNLVGTEQLKPNQAFLGHIKKFMRRKECEKHFKMEYRKWINSFGSKEELAVHPWSQYRAVSLTNSKHYREKMCYFKPRIAQRFKVRTATAAVK